MLSEYEFCLNYVIGLFKRRQKITTTYLSINSAIVAIIALVVDKFHTVSPWRLAVSGALLIAAIFICYLWQSIVKDLSSQTEWWYRQIRAIEDQTSGTFNLINREYKELYLKCGKSVGRITPKELMLIKIFFILYISAFALVVVVITRSLGGF